MYRAKQEQFKRLVAAYLSGTATAGQKSLLEQYFELFSGQNEVLSEMENSAVEDLGRRMKSVIDSRISQSRVNRFRMNQYSLSAAAVMLLACSLGFYFYFSSRPVAKSGSPLVLTTNDISPGHNQATLTLSDGSNVLLDGASAGKVAEESGMEIRHTSAGQLVYKGRSASSNVTAFNQVTTPRGGQYQVVLPDGTKVWLNAASSLRYPVVFGSKERRVELQGEGYFEVSSNPGKPFRVISSDQKVSVLGTHFNVNSYSDEAATRTTLLEGKVEVQALFSAASAVLHTGQQTVVVKGNAGRIPVLQVEADDVLAWKHGYFVFDDEPLESILRKVSRWYDVDIDYRKAGDLAREIKFSGSLSRYSRVSQLLGKIELSGSVHFKMEGRRICVLP